MEVTTRSKEDARRIELTHDDARRTDSKTVQLPYSGEIVGALLDNDSLSIKKLVLRRRWDGEAQIIDDYLLAGYDGKYTAAKYRHKPDYGTSNLKMKSFGDMVFRVCEESLSIKSHFPLVLDGPSEEIDAILNGSAQWEERRSEAAETAREKAAAYREKAAAYQQNAEKLDEMTFEEFVEEHDKEIVYGE